MADDVPTHFQSAKIVPDVVATPPPAFLSITYNGENLQFGNELTPTQVKDAPAVTWEAEPSTFYALCMFDPDARQSDSATSFTVLHWMIANVPGSALTEGDCLVEYIGSGPPEGSGLHRYIFLLYKQPGKLSFDSRKRISSRSKDGRLNFSVQRFTEKYGLGEPIAGNMYRAQYDDYVPHLYAQFTE